MSLQTATLGKSDLFCLSTRICQESDLQKNLLILGDFNVHLDEKDEPKVKKIVRQLVVMDLVNMSMLLHKE